VIFVLGIDAATWTVVRPNLDKLPCFKKLVELGRADEVVLEEKPVSPSIWCGMFSGKTFAEHGHDSFVIGDRLAKREDIPVDFVWDVLERQGKKVMALNVPFVVPPYSFRVDFKPVGFGLPTNEREWQEELDRVSEKIRELLAEEPDLLIAVYTLLDRVQHFHWGEECVRDWYRKLDEKMGDIILDSGFLSDAENKLIIISDHGMCSFGEARVQTLPERTEWGELKGDHHENALLITVNVDDAIEKPQDVFRLLIKEFARSS
jgi:predicted AlkP superfamily phosphohydrolase/phosphomutase